MATLTKLNDLVKLLQQNAAIVGVTIAGLLIAIYSVAIMLNNDQSPAARTQRWEQLQRVFICAAIIAGTGAFAQFATGLGNLL